ncbi:hypothetical protein C8J56DRAFT_1117837 [Mycena floridula]|nr:hypothetical protein C8J56DRAFT_1117837 [Mycena floridula]
MSDKADSGKISRKQTTVNQLAKLGNKNELQNTFAKQTKRRKSIWNPLEGAGHVGRNCKFLGPKIRENKTNPEEAGGEMCESKHREHTVACEVWASASKLWSLDTKQQNQATRRETVLNLVELLLRQNEESEQVSKRQTTSGAGQDVGSF